MAFASMLMWASFLLPTAFAQSGHFVFMQQSQVSSSTPINSSKNYTEDMGNGYMGSTTFAYMTYTFVKSGSYNYGVGSVSLQAYTDASYSSTIGSSCDWSNQYNSGANPHYVNGQNTVSSGFVQLDPINLSFTECLLNPAYFYRVTIHVQSASQTDPAVLYGLDSGGTFLPQFALTGDGFFITPTASSSGLFLSGANEFCASAFASSSAPGIVTDFGIAMCNVFGFMFVPTPASVQQFSDFSNGLQTKIPFAYYYDIADIINGSTASTTQNFTAYTINLSAIDFASSTGMGPILPTSPLEFFSSTTISKYLPVGMHDFIYNLMIWTIWIDLLWVLYHKIVPTKAKI